MKWKRKTSKKSSKSKLRDKADMWFSRMIRLKACNSQGFCQCIVTGKYYEPQRVDCGHYISRANLFLRYNEDNCHPQNRSSNRFSGEADKAEYREQLIKKIGLERVEALERKPPIVKYTEFDYAMLSDRFKAECKRILKEKSINCWWSKKR